MIQDAFLTEMAKALNSESYVVPNYFAFGTTVITPAASDTALTGETPSRVTVTKSRAVSSLTVTGIRTGASVTQATGITLYGFGVFNTSSASTLLTSNSLPGLLHTTSYDVQTDLVYTFGRS